MMSRKPATCLAALLTGLSLPARPAMAQAAPAKTPAQASRHSGPVTEDITVTATRRASSISKVPLSISAFSQKTLDQKGARNIADVVRFTPGVTFDAENNNISIRGIDSEAGTGTTGIYIDDTPVQIRNLGFNAENSLPELFDLDRVEVLRGPQGTLFGAGSEGGTVRYITPAPSLTKYSTYDRSTVSASQYGAPSYDVGSAIGGPIIKDVLGFRLSASYDNEGGFLDHTDYRTNQVTQRNTNGSKVTVLRAALAYQPFAGLLITPSILYQQRLVGDTDAYFTALSDPANGVFRTNAPERLNDTDRFFLPALNIKYDFGGLSLISNTSYLHRNNVTGYEGTVYNLSYYNTFIQPPGPGLPPLSPYYPLLLPTGINPLLPFYESPSRIFNQQRNFTQEVRVQSNVPDERVSWVAGAFYQHNKQLSSEQIQDPLADTLFNAILGESIADYFGAPLYKGIDSYINQTQSTDEQEAVFANATVRIVDGVKLDGGLRYAHTKFTFSNFASGSQNGGYTSAAGGASENPITGKLTLSWQIDPRNLVYAGYSRGYRVGGATPPVPADVCATDFQNFGISATPNTYGSDTVDSWEIGGKSRFLGNRLEIQASAYHIDWNNIQQNVLLPICAIQYTANLGKAVSQGFDIQATIRPIDDVTIDTSLGYDDAHFVADAFVAPGGALLAASGDSIGDATSANGTPHWKFSLGGQYDVPPEKFNVFGGALYLRGDYQFVDRPAGTTPLRDPSTVSFDPGYIRTDSTNYISLRAGLLFNEKVNVSLFVNNLLNATPILTREHQTAGSLLNYDTTLRPRYIGLQVTYRE